MASGYADAVSGTALTETYLDDNLMKQTVMKYASAAARTADAALTPALREGMYTYLDDINAFQVYSGTAWQNAIGPVNGTWYSYAGVTWTAAAGTPPAIGNGSLMFQYQVVGSRTIHFRGRVLFGSTTTYGSASGAWRLGIPVAANGTQPSQMALVSSSAAGAAPTPSPNWGYIDTSATYVSLGGLSNTTAVWAAGGYVLVNGTYEAGSDT